MLEVGLRRWPDAPEPSGEHEIVGIQINLPPTANLDDERFSIDFTTSGGHTLRVRLHADHMTAFGKALLEAAAERDQYPL